jgi:hypothetical protein
MQRENPGRKILDRVVPDWREAAGYRHPTYRDALTEAERLAIAKPGREFFVLGVETSLCSVAMQRVEYFDPADPIPF